jgi:hypothetical protein
MISQPDRGHNLVVTRIKAIGKTTRFVHFVIRRRLFSNWGYLFLWDPADQISLEDANRPSFRNVVFLVSVLGYPIVPLFVTKCQLWKGSFSLHFQPTSLKQVNGIYILTVTVYSPSSTFKCLNQSLWNFVCITWQLSPSTGMYCSMKDEVKGVLYVCMYVCMYVCL